MSMIVSIVEGHGEVKTLPLLIRRIAFEMGFHVHAPEAKRLSKGQMPTGLPKMLQAARAEIQLAQTRGAVLVVLDADDDCPAALGSALKQMALVAQADLLVVIAVANKEFEAWFLAAATSLRGRRGLPDSLEPPPNPETIRDAKGWLNKLMPQGYAPTVDQEKLAAVMDFTLATNAPSFQRFYTRVREMLLELNPADNSPDDAETSGEPLD